MKKRSQNDLRQGYRLRALASTVASLLLLIALVRLWPASAPGSGAAMDAGSANEMIQIEEIRPTRQSSNMKPPPPAPLPPVVVPDDVILEQEELDLTENFLPIQEPGVAGPPQERGETEVVLEGPKPVRLVEPEHPPQAYRRRIRAEVVLALTVDDRGRVQQTRVQKRYLLGKENEPPTEVDELGYGLEEAAIAAAERMLFRPARRNGKPIESETTISFSFGVEN